MNEKEVIEGNKLIAEFMGGKFNSDKTLIYFKSKPTNKYHRDDELKYHSSWDWLMPVVEKINSLDLGIDFPGEWFDVVEASILIHIESLWKFIIEFIKWYNSNPPA